MNKILKRTCIFIFFPLLVFASLVSTANQTAFAEGRKLSSDAKKVVDYLLADWSKKFRSTDIATAITNLDMKQDDNLRLSIAEHLRMNKGLAKNLRWWGPNNYILSNDEKRITKYLIHMIERNGGYPALAEAAIALNLSPKYLNRRLQFMEAAGIVKKSGNKLKYSLVDNYKTWGGPLRYNYHIIAIEGEQPFGVW